MMEVWNSVCFLRVLPFKKSVNDRRREGEKKVSCHMLELFFKNVVEKMHFEQPRRHLAEFIYMVIIASSSLVFVPVA